MGVAPHQNVCVPLNVTQRHATPRNATQRDAARRDAAQRDGFRGCHSGSATDPF